MVACSWAFTAIASVPMFTWLWQVRRSLSESSRLVCSSQIFNSDMHHHLIDSEYDSLPVLFLRIARTARVCPKCTVLGGPTTRWWTLPLPDPIDVLIWRVSIHWYARRVSSIYSASINRNIIRCMARYRSSSVAIYYLTYRRHVVIILSRISILARTTT